MNQNHRTQCIRQSGLYKKNDTRKMKRYKMKRKLEAQNWLLYELQNHVSLVTGNETKNESQSKSSMQSESTQIS